MKGHFNAQAARHWETWWRAVFINSILRPYTDSLFTEISSLLAPPLFRSEKSHFETFHFHLEYAIEITIIHIKKGNRKAID